MTDRTLPAPINFEDVPSRYEGKWVLVRVSPNDQTQEIVSSGDSVQDAIRGQPFGPEFLLARVPHKYSVLVVSDAQR